MNRTWSILLWLLGEAMILLGFYLYNEGNIRNPLILKMIVSSVIFTVFIMSLFRDSAILAKRGVSKGMKWFFTITYILLSISAMLYFEFFNPVDLLTQTIVQSIFLAVLALGMWGAFNSSKKNSSDRKYEKMEQRQLMMIRNVLDVARSRAERTSAVPSSLVNELIELQEEVRVMAPANEYVALKMEGNIMMEVNRIVQCLKMNPPDLNVLQNSVKHCYKLIREFRNTYQAPLSFS